MKKLFQIVSLLVLFSSAILAAETAKVYDSLKVEDQVGNSKMLYFGLDPAATDGVDVQFGENLLPPWPPLGAFEARLYLPASNFNGSQASWRDYRAMTAVPFSGMKEFRVVWQLADGSPGCKISWNLPAYLTGKLVSSLYPTDTLVITGVGNHIYTDPDVVKLKMFIIYAGVLPVELSSFTSAVNGSTVSLNWQTVTEKNNKGFQIERKSLNSNWENIGFVAGAGTSTESHSYSYNDIVTSAGSYTYRLKQVDLDGQFSYSKEVNAEVILNDFVLNQNYPNPFNPATGISFSVPQAGNVRIAIYDILGNEIKVVFDQYTEAGNYRTVWNGLNASGTQMSSGTYIYKMTAGNFVQSKKMILMK